MRDFKDPKKPSRSSGMFFKPTVQTKLAVGSPGDRFEAEADSMADKVVNKRGGADVQRSAMPGEEKVQQKPLADSISSVQLKEMPKEDDPVQKKAGQENEAAVAKKEPEEDPVQRKEEDEQVAKKEEPEEGNVQKKEEEQPAAKMEEEVPVQKKEGEQSAGMKEEETPVQKKEEGQPAGMKEEEASVQKKEEEETVAKKEEEKEEVQTKPATAAASSASPGVETRLRSSKGKGGQLDGNVRSEMERGFGADFSGVNIHTGSEATKLSSDLGAQAFTNGNDIYFNEGKYDPGSNEGKKLLAHELTHTIQQKGSKAIQRKHTADTGWRYTPPAKVKRSIIEIQGIVGATPDGVYGLDTKNAVTDYQNTLKARGLYADTVDGKWGPNTDIAHDAFALTRPYRAGYNCAGFAFKQFRWIDMPETKTILSGMDKSAHAAKTSPYHHKFWFWDVDVAVKNTVTGAKSRVSNDFHIVGGQTDSKGEGPGQVMSKNGKRPVEGPKAPLDWEVKSGPALDQDGNVTPNREWVISRSDLSVHSSKELP
jgi:hypothetical protein